MYAKGTAFTDVQMTDEELEEKFRRTAHGVLTKNKIDRAVKALLGLEQ